MNRSAPVGTPASSPAAPAAFSNRKHLLLIPVFALLPLLLYVVLGYGGQDFKYHAASWVELHNAWSAHEWELGWSQWAQFGFGEPRFCFYPPLSFLVGAALSFLLPFKLVPGVIVWLVLTLSGLSMYKAAGSFVRPEHRLFAALFYMFNPYLMMTVIIRYAIAEAWVQAFLPLTFLYVYLALVDRRPWPIGVSALLLAAGWLTNLPEAIGFFYAFGLLALVLAIRERSWKPLAAAAASQGLALALAAFRLLPVLAEKGFVASGNLLIYDFRNTMQLRRTPPPHLVVYASGVFILLALPLLFSAGRQAAKRPGIWRGAMLALLTLAAFAIAFQLPLTIPLWQALPQFRFVLFPYRLLPLLSLALVLLLFAPGVGARIRRLGAACLVLVALFPFLDYGRLLPFQRFHSLQAAAASWQTGFEGVEEYVPASVPSEAALPKEEARRATVGPFADRGCGPALLSANPDRRVVETGSETGSADPCRLTLNTFFYPFWQASLDGRALAVHSSGEGLLQVEVPGGPHRVTFTFEPRTRTRTVSSLLSLCTLAALLTGLAWARRSWSVPLFEGGRVRGMAEDS